MFQCKKILVPLDGSPLSEKALEPALATAKAMSAELVLLRVTPPVYLVADSIEIERLYAEVEAKAREEAELYLKGLRSQLQNVQVPVQVKTMSGPIAESIVDFADHDDVDLTVISSHGRSGVSRWVYGSVAEKVLRGARRATLMIRGNQIP